MQTVLRKLVARMLALSLSGMLLYQPVMTLAADPPANVFITQVQITGGVGKTGEDFIELFNPGSNPVNLNGYRLVKRSATGTADSSIKSWSEDTFIPARSFFLWANSTFTTIPVTPDSTTSTTLADNNGIAIRFGASDTGTLIDSASWGTSSNGFRNVSTENPGAGLSLTRTDTESTTSAFTISTSAPRNTTVALPGQYATPYATPYPTPGDPDPYATPYATPYETPYSTPYATPACDPRYVTPYNTPYASPYATPYETPYSTPYDTPYATPYETPYATPYVTPASTISNKVVITEILPNPDGDDASHEQIEIANTDSVTINLAGWELNDKTERSSSSVVLSGNISAGQVLAVTIPPGKFTLSNTGETVYLFDPAHNLIDQEAFGAAPSGKSWQLFNGSWSWSAPSLGSTNVAPEQVPVTPPAGGKPKQPLESPLLAEINEVLANPFGSDSGNEAIEIKNVGTVTLSTQDWTLDEKKSGAVSDSAILLPAATIEPNMFLVITLPEDFSLSNSSGNLRLFDGEGRIVDTVRYQRVQEGFSYAKTNTGIWQQEIPTLDSANGVSPVIPSLQISELLPYPESGEQEFVEIYNPLSEEIDLKNFIIKVGTRTKRLDEIIINPKEFGLITDGNLPSLPNTGSRVELQDPFGRLIDAVTYPKTAKGLSVSFDGSGFVASTIVTAGTLNEIERVELSPIKTKATSKKTTIKPSSKGTATLAPTLLKPAGIALAAADVDTESLPESVTQDPATPPRQMPLPFIVITITAGVLFALLFRQLFIKNNKMDDLVREVK